MYRQGYSLGSKKNVTGELEGHEMVCSPIELGSAVPEYLACFNLPNARERYSEGFGAVGYGPDSSIDLNGLFMWH